MRRLFLVLLCFILLLPVFGEDGEVVIDRKSSSFSFSGVLGGEDVNGSWEYSISVTTPSGALALNEVEPDSFTSEKWLDGFTLKYTSNSLCPISILLNLGPFVKEDSSGSTQEIPVRIPVKYRLSPQYEFVQGDNDWNKWPYSVSSIDFKNEYETAVEDFSDISVVETDGSAERSSQNLSFGIENAVKNNFITVNKEVEGWFGSYNISFNADVIYTLEVDFQYAGEGDVSGNDGDGWRYPDGTYVMDVYVTVECEA